MGEREGMVEGFYLRFLEIRMFAFLVIKIPMYPHVVPVLKPSSDQTSRMLVISSHCKRHD